MNLPNLPTDSLYKFMALSGVVVILASVAVPTKLIDSMLAERDRLVGEIAAVGYEAKAVRAAARSTQRDSAVAGLFVSQTKLLAAMGDVDGLMEHTDRLTAWYDSLDRQSQVQEAELNMLLARLERLKAQTQTINRRLESTGALRGFRLLGLCLGVLLSGLGFYLWLSRLQQYVDASIKSRQAP